MGLITIISLLLLVLFSYQSCGEDVIDSEPIAQYPMDRRSLSHVLQLDRRGGASSAEEEAKIVGGIEILPNSWPFLVIVAKKIGKGMYPICGGTIVDPNYVISAAHCFNAVNVVVGQDRVWLWTESRNERLDSSAQYSIVAGEHDYSVFKGNEQIIDVEVERHPNYTDGPPFFNDVAVLKLSKPLKMTEEVQAMDLNTDGTCPQPDTRCFVAGWGLTEHEGKGSKVPLEVVAPIHPQDECYKVFGTAQFGEDQICGGEKDQGFCQGDSGGPLLCECDGVEWLTGIVSYMVQCTAAGYPESYARVSYFVPWITETMQRM